jgi:hypothetical protein
LIWVLFRFLFHLQSIPGPPGIMGTRAAKQTPN